MKVLLSVGYFFFSSRRRHTRFDCDWSSDVCSSDLLREAGQKRRESFAERISCGGKSFDSSKPSCGRDPRRGHYPARDRKSTRLNSSHSQISYAVFCLKKKK